MANVRVALRVRPLCKRENAEGARIVVNVDDKLARIRNLKLDYKSDGCGDTRERLIEFGFDYCYWSVDPEDPKYASQEVVFQDLGTTVLTEAINGYNVCLFAYGQTGSGKTYTMMGTPTSIGLTPRICEGLFSYNDHSAGSPSSCRIEVSFLEIYNERVRDLLHPSDQKKPYTLRVREHPEKGPYVQGLSQHAVTDYGQVMTLLEEGMENRITAATHVHDASSRSHAIFTIQYTQAMLEDNLPSEMTSKINLVDLAGSERASPNYCKDRLTEGSNINRSLVTLGIVISALAQNSQMTSSCQSINSIVSEGDSGVPSSPSGSSGSGSKRHPYVPYRDSILTWLLKDSLGGNSKTIMIATVSPASSSYNETMSTLRYASNAKNIINKPRVNEDANVKLIRELREEINRLKAMLRNFEMSLQRTISPSFGEERDGNLTELVLQNELKIEQLTKDWTDKWTDKAALVEEYNVDINKGKTGVTIDSSLPHLIAMDDDLLSTGVVIYHLREGATNIGRGDHDIVLQGECIEQDHCVIEKNCGVVELRSDPGALCTVNGQEVTEVCRLSQGAVIVLGKFHRFRFNHPAEAAVLRQMRSDSQASSVSDNSLDWLDLSADISSSSNGNSLILNSSNTEPLSEEYQQRLRDLQASYQQQVDEQQQYVEDLKRQIQSAQVKGEEELENEQSLINQQIQETQQWLEKEKQRLTAVCGQRRESAAQTETKTYAEAEVQNSVQIDSDPSPEEQDRKKLVQLELLRKCSLRRAERNIRRKRVKFQLERIVKKQKLLEAKKTLQQLQAACWHSDDTVRPPTLRVPKVKEPLVFSTALHRCRSSPSGFSHYRRCSLPWTLPTPPTYSGVLKRKCKSELVHISKIRKDCKPLRSVSIDCLARTSCNYGSYGQLISDPSIISTSSPQTAEKQSVDSHTEQINSCVTLFPSDPEMSKTRQKMEKAGGRPKGSSSNSSADPPKRRNVQATVNTGSKDTKLKALKSPSLTSVVDSKKSTVQERSKLQQRNEGGKSLPHKPTKNTQKLLGQGRTTSGESLATIKTARRNITSCMPSTQKKQTEGTNKFSSVDNISKLNSGRGHGYASDSRWVSTERLQKRNIQPLEKWKDDDNSVSSDSESFYSVDSLSSAYASVLTEQLKQEDLERQRSSVRKGSDSEDSQLSEDSLVERDSRKERPNKRRFNKYKTIGTSSSPSKGLLGAQTSCPLVTTGSVTTGLSKSFSLDSLADAEEEPDGDSSEELPAEIFWKLQSPRCLVLSGEDQKVLDVASAEENPGLDRSGSFYLKMNDGASTVHSDVSQVGKTHGTLSDICGGKTEQNHNDSFILHSPCAPFGIASQNCSPEQTVNILHGDSFSLSTLKFAPKIDSSGREDVMKQLVTKDSSAKIEHPTFPALNAQTAQDTKPCEEQVKLCNVVEDEINTNDNRAIPNQKPEQTPTSLISEKQENVNEFHSTAANSMIKHNPLDNTSSNVKAFLENKVDQEKPQRSSPDIDNGTEALDLESIHNGKSSCFSSQSSSVDLSTCEKTISTSEKNSDPATCVEQQFPCKIQSQEKEEGTEALLFPSYDKIVYTPSNSVSANNPTGSEALRNANNNDLQFCLNKMSDIPLFNAKETCETKEGLILTLTKDNGDVPYINDRTAKNCDQNKNVTMAISAHGQLDMIKSQKQSPSSTCPESTSSELLVGMALHSDSVSPKIIGFMSPLKVDDQQINSDFKTTKLLSQTQVTMVELDVNDNEDCKTETQPSLVFNANHVFNHDNRAVPIQRPTGDGLGNIPSAENADSSVTAINKQLSVVEEKSLAVFADQSEADNCASPIQDNFEHKRKLTISSFPASNYSNVKDRPSVSGRHWSGHGNEDSETHAHSSQLHHSPFQTSPEITVDGICSSSTSVVTDSITRNSEQILTSSNQVMNHNGAAAYSDNPFKENDEDQHFSVRNGNISRNSDKNCYMSKLVATSPTPDITGDVAGNTVKSCLQPNFRTKPEVYDTTYDTSYIKYLKQIESTSMGPSKDGIEQLPRLDDDNPCVTPYSVSGEGEEQQAFCEDKITLPEDRVLISSDTGSETSCFSHRMEEFPHNQSTTETFINSEYSNDENPNECLSNTQTEGTSDSYGTSQADRAQSALLTSNHVFPNSELDKQCCSFSEINVTADSVPPLCKECHCEKANCQIHPDNNQKPQVLNELMGENNVSKIEDSSQANEKISIKHLSRKNTYDQPGVAEMSYEKDISHTKDSAASKACGYSRKHFTGSRIIGIRQQGDTDDVSYTDVNHNLQEKCDCHHLTEDTSATCLHVPYYEAIMQHNVFYETKYPPENLYLNTHSKNKESSNTILIPEPSGLNTLQETDMHAESDCAEHYKLHCSRTLDRKTGQTFVKPEKEASVPSRTVVCITDRPCAVTNSSASSATKVAKPKQGVAQQVTYSATGLDSMTCSCNVTGKSEKADEQVGHEQHLNEIAGENFLLENNQNQPNINIHRSCENAFAMNTTEDITVRTSVCTQKSESTSCQSEADYATSDSKSMNNLLNATLCDTAPYCTQSGNVQEVTSEPPKIGHFQANEDNKGVLAALCADTESREVLFVGRPYCAANMEAKRFTDYQASCQRPPEDAATGEEETLEHNVGSKSEVSHFIRSRSELEQLIDKNTPLPADVFDTSTVRYGAEPNNPSVAQSDIGFDEDNNLLTTVVYGEYCSDLNKSPEISSSEEDTEKSRSLASRDFSGVNNTSVEDLGIQKECKSDFHMGIRNKTVHDVPQAAICKGEMSASLTCTNTHYTTAPSNLPAPMAAAELHLTESSIILSTKSLSKPSVEALPHKLNCGGKPVSNEYTLKMESMQHTPHTDYRVQKHDCISSSNQASNSNMNPQHNYDMVNNMEVEGKVFLENREPTKTQRNEYNELPLHTRESSEELVENTEGLHFSSSDINPFVHTWQQEKTTKVPGWRSSAFNSASDVSCTKFQARVDKLIRCSSADDGLNAHNSPFHSHLSSYANAKTESSTISSFGGNDSRLISLDGSQDLLSDDTAAICSGAEFIGTCELQTKCEDYSNLDEIMILYTSESETCNETHQRVSCERETQIKQKHRRAAKHHRSHMDESSSRHMRSKNMYQRPASWSSVQNMSLHLSQLLQETSELLGNLSQHHPENVYLDASKLQKDAVELIMKRQVRDSSTQTSVDRGIQTDSQATIDSNAQKHDLESNHFLNASGINVFVKVVGTDSSTQSPQNTSLTVEQNDCKTPKTKTQSLPNLHTFVSCKQSEHSLSQSSKVRASTPYLNDLQDMSSTALPLRSPRSSPASSSVNKHTEALSHTVVISPSSSVLHSPRYYTTCRGNTTMVDRASSPILTLSASKKSSLHKYVPENQLNNPNLVKILCHRKRRERGIRDPLMDESHTETDSECFSSFGKSNIKNEFEAPRSHSLKESCRKRTTTYKVQKFRSEGCILRDTHSTFNNHSSSNSEISGVGKMELNCFTSTPSEKASANTFTVLPPLDSPQSLENLFQMSHPVPNKNDQALPQGPREEYGNDETDHGRFTVASSNLQKINPYLPLQISGFDLQEDGLSVADSDSNTDILLGQEPTVRINQKPQNYALQDLPQHNKFSNWSGVQCSTPKSAQLLGSTGDLNRSESSKMEASQEVFESRSREIERLQRERAEVMSGIHLEMNPQPLTVQLAEAKLSYGIGETDALLRVIQTRKMDGEDTGCLKKQLYERHLQVIENLRKEREDRMQRFRRSRSLSPQKQLSVSQASLTSLRESDLPSRRREYLQQLRKDIVDNTRIQEPKKRSAQCPSEIGIMLKDYQKAREETKLEIARARDKLRERAELEKRRLQQSNLLKDTKRKTLASTSTLFTSSSLSLSSGPTSGYNSGMTATLGQSSKLGIQEADTLQRNLDPHPRPGRGRPTVRNCQLPAASQIAPVSGPTNISHSPEESSTGKAGLSSLPHVSLLQSTPMSYQGLATKIQASAMAEVMAACSYNLNNLYNHQAEAGWMYQSTEKDVLVYYKSYSLPTQHGFIGAGVIKRPLHDVWCMVRDINTRQLYDQSILTCSVHQRLSGNIQLVHVMMDMSLCYLKQPRDFCCITVESKEEKCYSLSFQSVYNESMPRPNKDTVRGELLPSAWILQSDLIGGEAVTRVIYMVQVDLGAPAIPSRLLRVVSKRQPLVIASLASFLSR
ncbi:stAR-related lipid transfer protein 9 [Pseudophryne corroboree]|uniref:stAR-related lipid transfer protein 9 n=1 Tax=Pseudophryne corroboree TaxID=495146 RepID=UPI003081BFE3